MTASVMLLQKAMVFYERGPDGQYDHVAAACIREKLERVKCELRTRKLDKWVKRKYGVNARFVKPTEKFTTC